jgi:hypothetical protein
MDKKNIYFGENEFKNKCSNSIIWQLLAEERQEALYFLQGESPCWVRSSQPPIPSVASKWVTIR